MTCKIRDWPIFSSRLTIEHITNSYTNKKLLGELQICSFDSVYQPDWVQHMSFQTCFCTQIFSNNSQRVPLHHTRYPVKKKKKESKASNKSRHWPRQLAFAKHKCRYLLQPGEIHLSSKPWRWWCTGKEFPLVWIHPKNLFLDSSWKLVTYTKTTTTTTAKWAWRQLQYSAPVNV